MRIWKLLSVFPLVATSVVATNAAYATLTPSYPRGEKIVEIRVPGRANEICVIPSRLADAKYSKDDLQTEGDLCGLDEYASAAVCPKTASTNPGIEFYLLPPGFTPSRLEAQNCFEKDPANPKENLAKKVAKYKYSTSCSYTPSILSYYHISRFLGEAGKVPTAVLRTFDVRRHKEIGEIALRITKPGDDIHLTWQSAMKYLGADGGSKRDALMTDALDQTYGALQENPRGEAKYSELFFERRGDGTRADAFRDRSPDYAVLANGSPIEKLVGTEFNQANAQKLQRLKDVADMIVMDTILSQEDRFGNLHYVEKYAFLDQKETDKLGRPKFKLKKKLKPEEIAELKAVKVREMLMKDNDCGVNRENRAAKARLLEGIRHIDPVTYSRVLKLDAIADQPEVVKTFKTGMMFTSSDFAQMRKNLKAVATTLRTACASDQLKLDLDRAGHFSGVSSEMGCDGVSAVDQMLAGSAQIMPFIEFESSKDVMTLREKAQTPEGDDED